MLKKKSEISSDLKFNNDQHNILDELNILRARAAVLAIPESKEKNKNFINCTLFKLSNETYAVENNYINKVLSSKGITKIPRTPDYFEGIMNNHGIIIPIINLKIILNLKNQKEEANNQNKIQRNVIVISIENANLGLIIDDIIGQKDIETDSIQDNVQIILGNKKEYLKGVTLDHIAILDPNKIINDKILFSLDSI